MFKKKILYQTGKPFLVSGLFILFLGLLYFLLPWISQQVSFAGKKTTLPLINRPYIVCLQKEIFTSLETYLHQWQQLNNQQKINLVTFTDYPLEDCHSTITNSKISDNSQILYNFSGVWVTHKDSSISRELSVNDLLKLKKNNQIINLLPLSIEGILPTSPSSTQLFKKNKLYILSANNVNQYLGKIQLINLAKKSLLNKDNHALISGKIYITENLTTPLMIPLRDYLQTSLANDLFNTDSLDKVIVSGRSKIGAQGDFIYQVTISKQQLNNLTTADLTILANQTALSDRCSQRLNSIYLCGRPASWQKFASNFDVVFQYGKSSLHYDYDDFITTLQLYTKQTGQVIGATTDKTYTEADFKTNNYNYHIYGFNLGVRPQFCHNPQANLPAGLICVNSIIEIKQQITKTTGINLIYIYSPNQLDVKSLQTILEGATQAVILLTPKNQKTKITWLSVKGVKKAILEPSDYWIINSPADIKNVAKAHLLELYFYKNKFFWAK